MSLKDDETIEPIDSGAEEALEGAGAGKADKTVADAADAPEWVKLDFSGKQLWLNAKTGEERDQDPAITSILTPPNSTPPTDGPTGNLAGSKPGSRPSVRWTPTPADYQLPEKLKPYHLKALHIQESSSGANKLHDPNVSPDDEVGAGKTGALPSTIRAWLKSEPGRRPITKKLYQPLLSLSDDALTTAINTDDKMDDDITGQMWADMVENHGGDVYAARREWRKGPMGNVVWDKARKQGVDSLSPAEARTYATVAADQAQWHKSLRAAEGTEPPDPDAQPRAGAQAAVDLAAGKVPASAPVPTPQAPMRAPTAGRNGAQQAIDAAAIVAGGSADNSDAPALPNSIADKMRQSGAINDPARAEEMHAATVANGDMLSPAAKPGPINTSDLHLETPAAGTEPTPAAAMTPADQLRGEIDRRMQTYDAALENDARVSSDMKKSIDAKIAEIGAGKIDPAHFFASRSSAARILSVIAQGLGAAGAAISHGPNAAAEMLQHAMDSDIAAQKASLDSKHTALGEMIKAAGSYEEGVKGMRMLQYEAIKALVDELGKGGPSGAGMGAGKMAGDIAGLAGTLAQIRALEVQHSKLGVFSGVQAHLPADTPGVGDPNAVNYARNAQLLVAETLHNLSGATVSDKERAYLEQLIPSAGTTKGTATADFKALEDWVSRKFRMLNEAAKKTYGRDFDSLAPAQQTAVKDSAPALLTGAVADEGTSNMAAEE